MTKVESPMTPLRAIRAKCLDCCCGQAPEVKLCPAEDCPLWAYRLGKNPNIRREMTEEQREKARLRAILLNAKKHDSRVVQKSET